MIETIRTASTTSSIAGGSVTAGIKATEHYREGSVLSWLDGNAVVIGLGIAFAGLLVQVAVLIIKTLSARSKRLNQKREKPASVKNAGSDDSETF